MPQKIRTTHVGSLPRPEELVPFLRSRHQDRPVDEAAFAAACRRAVLDCVAKQVACGVDIVSDGEMAKISYAYYVQDRLNGLESAMRRRPGQEVEIRSGFNQLLKAGARLTSR